MNDLPASPARRSAGFTLLELMVVLVLIGIIFGFAVLSLGGDDVAELMEQETRRLGTLLELASDEAVLRGEELAVHFSENEYEFLMLQADSWQSSAEDNLLKAHSLPADIEMLLAVEGEPPAIGVSEAADEEAADQQDDRDSPAAVTPQVFILSSGEMTPFTVTLQSYLSPYRYHLTTTLLGKVSWEVEETL